MPTATKAACQFRPDLTEWRTVSVAKRLRQFDVWKARGARRTNRDSIVAELIARWIGQANIAIDLEARIGRTRMGAVGVVENAARDTAAYIEDWQDRMCGLNR